MQPLALRWVGIVAAVTVPLFLFGSWLGVRLRRNQPTPLDARD